MAHFDQTYCVVTAAENHCWCSLSFTYYCDIMKLTKPERDLVKKAFQLKVKKEC